MSNKLLKRGLLYLVLGIIWTYLSFFIATLTILLESQVLSIILYPLYFTLIVGSMISSQLHLQTGYFTSIESFFGYTPTFLINAAVIALVHHLLIKRKKAKK